MLQMQKTQSLGVLNVLNFNLRPKLQSWRSCLMRSAAQLLFQSLLIESLNRFVVGTKGLVHCRCTSTTAASQVACFAVHSAQSFYVGLPKRDCILQRLSEPSVASEQVALAAASEALLVSARVAPEAPAALHTIRIHTHQMEKFWFSLRR